jgi:hypothetical protein
VPRGKIENHPHQDELHKRRHDVTAATAGVKLVRIGYDELFCVSVLTTTSEHSLSHIGDPQQSMVTADSSSAEISIVPMRLPPFWTERAAMWFAQAKAQFSLAGISSESTKLFHVISQLDHWYAAEVKNIIISPTQRDPYTTLSS